jgi:hypothetical protein
VVKLINKVVEGGKSGDIFSYFTLDSSKKTHFG